MALMIEAVRTSETSVDNHFTRQYIPEDNSEHDGITFWDLAPIQIHPYNPVDIYFEKTGYKHKWYKLY
jgi:hypothetical protein